MNKQVKTNELFNCTTEYLAPLFNSCEYPWEMLPKIKEYILSLIEKGIAYRDNQLAKQTKEVDPYDLSLLFKE